MVPLTNPASQTTIEQPLDLSKKEALTQSACKENDSSWTKTATSSLDEPKIDNPPAHNPDTDDLEDSPLVIDEEITDSTETKRTAPAPIVETVPKVNGLRVIH